MKRKSLLAFTGLALAAGAFTMVVNTQANSKEEYAGPKYEVIAQLNDEVELREYAPRIVAQVDLIGDERSSLNRGFSILAGYIFGRNNRQDRISMTAPVLAEPEKAEMRAAVGSSNSSQTTTMSFFMPAGYSLETLPEPEDRRIKLRELPAQKYAAIRFSGAWNPDEFKKQASRLAECLEQNELATAGAPINAYYNSPFTLPFMRRNEVLLPVSN